MLEKFLNKEVEIAISNYASGNYYHRESKNNRNI